MKMNDEEVDVTITVTSKSAKILNAVKIVDGSAKTGKWVDLAIAKYWLETKEAYINEINKI
jgi:hypothetical protein